MKKLIFMFLLLPSLLSANELGNILGQIITNRISQKSPEAGQILRAVVPNTYVAPNTRMSVGRRHYNNPSSSTKMYPEPQTARDYVVYGKLLGNAGKVEEAAQYFLIARNMEPDNPEARYGLALSLALMGQTERAREEYEALQRLTRQLIEKTDKISRLLRQHD